MSIVDRSISITGMGVVCRMAHDVEAFAQALKAGHCGITRLPEPTPSVKVAATMGDFAWQDRLQSLLGRLPSALDRHRLARRLLQNSPDSTRWSTCAALEAFLQSDNGDGLSFPEAGERTGLIVAGSNLSQEMVAPNLHRFREEGRMNPRYAFTFLDTHQVGVISEILGLRGPGVTLGAASASGNAALFNAMGWLRGGVVDRCLVVGASAGFSALELEAFSVLGAASEADDPATAARPFDAGHSGFVWGEASAALMLETPAAAKARHAPVWGSLVGASLLLDGHHLPDPSVEGEIRSMQRALEDAGLPPSAIGYVNAHGTSSPLGDKTECEAIRSVFGAGKPWVNATKSLTGHAIGAAGIVEAVATLLQLERRFLHPNRNLEHPIDDAIAFAGACAQPLESEYGLSNAFGFGGFNSTLIFQRTSRQSL